jgi:hypothetical protein
MKINTQNNEKKVLFGMGVKLGISHYWKKRDEGEIAVLSDAATFCLVSACHVSEIIFSINRTEDDADQRIHRNFGTLLPECTA